MEKHRPRVNPMDPMWYFLTAVAIDIVLSRYGLSRMEWIVAFAVFVASHQFISRDLHHNKAVQVILSCFFASWSFMATKLLIMMQLFGFQSPQS
jgi:hypothetical protein